MRSLCSATTGFLGVFGASDFVFVLHLKRKEAAQKRGFGLQTNDATDIDVVLTLEPHNIFNMIFLTGRDNSISLNNVFTESAFKFSRTS